MVLAPGVDPVGGRALAGRLRELFIDRQVELQGHVQLEVRVSVGAAYRSGASRSGWTIRALAAEAELNASEPLAIESVA